MFFQTNEFSAVDDVQNDFQHSFDSIIDKYGKLEDFPKVEMYGTDKSRVEDYLFEKQVILDSEGTERSRYTLAGVLVILPVVVLAAFPEDSLPLGKYAVFLGMAIGLLLYGCVSLVRKYRMRSRLQKLDLGNPEEVQYVADVFAFAENVNE